MQEFLIRFFEYVIIGTVSLIVCAFTLLCFCIVMGICDNYKDNKLVKQSVREELEFVFSEFMQPPLLAGSLLKIILVSAVISFPIAAINTICSVSPETKEHMQHPCEQCRFKKIEKTYYDKNHNQIIDEKYIWIKCPTLERKK